ncbi:cytochrome P450 [Arthroderma uncinatum]|uniref:cytochrome P450 n=1 Tax=Arthroderma uncinatum TaxID=74035 RepID=UPI00144A52F4|nr:cytochrome P450 [Arthroderma uncinatum]KAF3491748.1 cytochrome P450 [Arthroderma uncinatum]
MVNDTDEFLPSLLGEMKGREWAKFNPLAILSSLLMVFSTSVVLGPEFSRDTELVEQITSHVLGIELVLAEFDRYPRILWPLVWGFSSATRNFRSNILNLKKRMVPEIKYRIKMLRSGEKADEDLTMLTLFLKLALKDGILSQQECPGSEEKQVDSLFMKTLFHIYEIWGPIAPLTGAMFAQAMANLELVGELREEISSSLVSLGGWKPDILTQTRTPKLESFTREILRLHAPISSK